MRGFWAFFVLYLLIGGALAGYYPKGTLERWVNTLHQPALDFFFAYYTFVGDGIFYTIVALALMWYRSVRLGAWALGACLLTGAVAQSLKLFVFTDAPRPKAFFGEGVGLHFVEGVAVHLNHSFPSGHTVSAWSLAFFLCWCMPRLATPWGALLAGMACLVGCSRVYLMQHFWIDTYWGAILGVGLTLWWCRYYPDNQDQKMKS